MAFWIAANVDDDGRRTAYIDLEKTSLIEQDAKTNTYTLYVGSRSQGIVISYARNVEAYLRVVQFLDQCFEDEPALESKRPW